MTCAATLTFDEALAILRAAAAPLGIEQVPLDQAGRRVVAEPVRARIDMPRYDTAAMDGYASIGPLTTGARMVGVAYPGDTAMPALSAGETVRIMTGAPMPIGADRVIPVELAEELDGVVQLVGPAPSRNHVRTRGSDMIAGAEVLPIGTILDPRALVTAAAADMARLTCWRRPTVSIVAGGDELVKPGDASAHDHAVPDSLSHALLLFARQWGAKPLAATLVRDDPRAIHEAAGAALDQADVLVLVGGASRGDRDFARTALAPLGLEIRFADVAMKPGKPAWYGRIGDRYVVGLPGNPAAAMTVARLFLAPLLHALGGLAFDEALRWQKRPLVAAIEETSTRERFLGARQRQNGVEIIEKQTASDQISLSQADWLVRLPPNVAMEAGSFVETIRF